MHLRPAGPKSHGVQRSAPIVVIEYDDTDAAPVSERLRVEHALRCLFPPGCGVVVRVELAWLEDSLRWYLRSARASLDEGYSVDIRRGLGSSCLAAGVPMVTAPASPPMESRAGTRFRLPDPRLP